MGLQTKLLSVWCLATQVTSGVFCCSAISKSSLLAHSHILTVGVAFVFFEVLGGEHLDKWLSLSICSVCSLISCLSLINTAALCCHTLCIHHSLFIGRLKLHEPIFIAAWWLRWIRIVALVSMVARALFLFWLRLHSQYWLCWCLMVAHPRWQLTLLWGSLVLLVVIVHVKKTNSNVLKLRIQLVKHPPTGWHPLLTMLTIVAPGYWSYWSVVS